MSTDESASPETMHPDPVAQPKQGSLLRIVLIVLLVLAVIALIIDRRSQSAAQELHDSLADMFDTAPARDKPKMGAIREKIGFEPATTYDHEKAPNMKVEEYRFRGGLPWRNYTVYVYYRTLPEERMYSVSLNQPEDL